MSALYEDIVKFVANNLKCSICFNIFTKPVTLVCGHNYCQKCVSEYWASSAKRDCPHCRKVTSSNALETNFTLCDILELQELGGRESWDFLAETDSDYKTQHTGRTITKVEKLIKHLDWLKAEMKKTEVKLSAELNSNKDYEIFQKDGSSFDSDACSADRSFSLTSEYHQEQPSQSEKESLQEFVKEEEDPGNSDPLFEAAYLTPSASAQKYHSSCKAVLHAEFIHLSFSPELGNWRLAFLPKSLTVATKPGHHVKTSHGRFDACQWMAEQEFREGRVYWDVVTTHSRGWAVGVAYPSLMRGERLGRTSSSWCLEWSSGQLSVWHNNLKISVKHSVPDGIRVILDMAKGQLCFQSLNDNFLELYSFMVNFSGPVRPVFWLYGLSQNALTFPRQLSVE